ncbi:hypothetical protein MGG_14605 [Pyricularia oryzae 70-15]|uniref:Uncharacterized protein n=1 Tax=Pyricularia oryzae (strain 70-15 / ATCC MYA-4617 / FGSC 8958) TaxID=242507 RepID=G4MNB2_PYRO7|nr:uncharacterized protein MGG_14605 [Pyricularia oryzae 70-15]EHA56235.1 hypothetical protein MGG_14605 [Pyricularia oryzae 70-15]
MTVVSRMSARVFMGKGICDGFVKKGTRVGTPWPTAMLIEDYYDHPERYDPYRYIKMREESPSHENRTHLVNVSDEHFGFGHGYHAFPGRFFAANEIKIALAHMLLKRRREELDLSALTC